MLDRTFDELYPLLAEGPDPEVYSFFVSWVLWFDEVLTETPCIPDVLLFGIFYSFIR